MAICPGPTISLLAQDAKSHTLQRDFMNPMCILVMTRFTRGCAWSPQTRSLLWEIVSKCFQWWLMHVYWFITGLLTSKKLQKSYSKSIPKHPHQLTNNVPQIPQNVKKTPNHVSKLPKRIKERSLSWGYCTSRICPHCFQTCQKCQRLKPHEPTL